MSRRIRLLTGATALAVLAALYVLGMRFAYLKEVSCEQPCRDLGTNGDTVRQPLCAPLKLELGLADPKARIGRRYSLWYRVRMTNTSCFLLHALTAEHFMTTRGLDSAHATGIGLYLRVLDPDGNELAPLGAPTGAERTEYGSVIPYRFDHKASQKAFKELSVGDHWSFDFLPGRSIETIPSVLEPRQHALVAPALPCKVEGGERVCEYAEGEMHVENPGAPEPPAGFRILDQYVFKRGGRYRIQAVYEYKELWAEPIYRYDHLAVGPIFLVKDLFGVDLIHSRRHGKYFVRAVSDPVEFEVVP
ncbi:MAG: hypothetical protein A2X36_15020 [Elusimicrobia bacterium GWA2_69_24]|nr:MAG: hypothetical protein A2X36_15020 [Elusimicrobia bacterium GWA2_69_24]HBL18961.1 hypothetical protein [Elusimicrobiota bacterium]